MIDADTGWAVTHKQAAHTLLRTTDGGAHWQDVTPLPSSGPSASVAAATVLTSSIAWVADDTDILRTTDGGGSWRRMNLVRRDSASVQSIDFVDPRDGWILINTGEWMGNMAVEICRTVDGGEHWVKILSVTPSSEDNGLPRWGKKNAITFRSATTGWITGMESIAHDVLYFYATHDAGWTWRKQGLSVPPQVRSPWFAMTAPPTFFAAQDGILPVSYSSASTPASYAAVVVIYVTHDGGATWAYTTPVSAAPLNLWDSTFSTSGFIDMSRGWATDGDALHTTSDGGRQWTNLAVGQFFADAKQIDFVSDYTGWAVIKTSPYLLKTVDGGRTWFPVSYVISSR